MGALSPKIEIQYVVANADIVAYHRKKKKKKKKKKCVGALPFIFYFPRLPPLAR